MSRAAVNEKKLPGVELPDITSLPPYQMITAIAMPPKDLHNRVGEGAYLVALQDDVKEAFVFIPKAPVLIFFHGKGLDDALAGNGLMEKTGQPGNSLLVLKADLPKRLPKATMG